MIINNADIYVCICNYGTTLPESTYALYAYASQKQWISNNFILKRKLKQHQTQNDKLQSFE